LISQTAATAATIDEAVTAVITTYCNVADEDWTLYSFHLLQLHRFLGYWNDEDGDTVSAVAAIVRTGIASGEIPNGNPELLAGMALGIVTQVAQNLAYGRLKPPLSQYAPDFIRAIMAVLSTR
jgi:hypothetical protein